MHLSFADLLTLLFVGLKLGHVIDWSWWLVMTPLLTSVLLKVFIEVVKEAAKK